MTRCWYLHPLDGVAVARNGWPRFLGGRPYVVTRDPGGGPLPGRTREDAWAAAVARAKAAGGPQ